MAVLTGAGTVAAGTVQSAGSGPAQASGTPLSLATTQPSVSGAVTHQLAFTGSNATLLVAVGIILIMTGIMLVGLMRRHRPALAPISPDGPAPGRSGPRGAAKTPS